MTVAPFSPKLYYMFSFENCSFPGCDTFRATGDIYCLHHSDKKEEIIANAKKAFISTGDIFDYVLNGASFSSLEIKNKRIIGSTFSFTVFKDCTFENVTIINAFFDFALFQNCTFKGCSIRYSNFSGSTFNICTIHDSTVIHDNFNGANINQSDFSENDFYYSTFIMSKLIQVKMEDCNLKRSDFSASIVQGISFKYSNPDEAQFKKKVEWTI